MADLEADGDRSESPVSSCQLSLKSDRSKGLPLHFSNEPGPSYTKEKMMCIILLLINLTSCVCGTFVVNVTQTSYQAEENHNITLEFTFTTKPGSSLDSLFIYCELLTDLRASVLYDLHGGVEVPESQDGQFKGRVQCDKDVLREGRLRLHVSRLRTDDSGSYQCEVFTHYGSSTATCRLTVTATKASPKPVRSNPTSAPQPESWGWIVLYCLLVLTAAPAVAAVAAAAVLDPLGSFLFPAKNLR